jgi:hypothetical protein
MQENNREFKKKYLSFEEIQIDCEHPFNCNICYNRIIFKKRRIIEMKIY